ncbi:DUF2968 domain-containing protein [Rhodanobacter sp. C01]|uniref:DUF2968 domain-containing protein n=1 Tax=Rhodanobacter sp. C01 TaxID=1945856 RepID=UPI000985E84C|nr:DUF2968 domain-containing protein [Rhodanobacter sp. C01]OOG50317.1 hypothetical protein B0E50_03135 [Rhodanobacter sp. C01]
MNPITSSANAQRLFMPLVMLVSFGVSAFSFAAQPPQAHTSEANSASDVASGSTVNYLLQLMDSHQLTELRTTYNGTYGASLLFQIDKLTYFVALFHDKMFWRVIQTYSEKDAESIYRTFAAQTEQLAEVDIDALRLQAGKKYAEHMVAMNEQRLQNLQQDAARQQQQAQEVMVQQQQAKQQAVMLSSDLRSASNQLDAVQQHIHTLEAQQNNPELILPAPGNSVVHDAPDASPAVAPASSNVSH